MTANQSLATRTDFQPVVDLVINGLGSDHSRRVYRKAITDFLTWWELAGHPPMVKATVQRYKVEVLDKSGLSPATINQRIAAVRKLGQEAADNGLLDQQIANGISKVKGAKTAGVRSGRWLSKVEAERLINAPGTDTLKGLRDHAILALLLGAGLRRGEVAQLTFDQLQQREGRWCVIDLVGKGRRVRTVPIPGWAKVAVDNWAAAAGLSSGKVFRGVYHYGKTLQPDSDGITPQAVFYAVQSAAVDAGLDISPHDLRRTFAKLARKGGAELTQIQIQLGHSSAAVTQKYINEDQDFSDAPCDRLGLDLSGD